MTDIKSIQIAYCKYSYNFILHINSFPILSTREGKVINNNNSFLHSLKEKPIISITGYFIDSNAPSIIPWCCLFIMVTLFLL